MGISYSFWWQPSRQPSQSGLPTVFLSLDVSSLCIYKKVIDYTGLGEGRDWGICSEEEGETHIQKWKHSEWFHERYVPILCVKNIFESTSAAIFVKVYLQHSCQTGISQ